MAGETLLTRTHQLLEQRDLSLREIALEADVPCAWLRALTYGYIKEPGVTRLEKVYNYLSETKTPRGKKSNGAS